jgi:hypothetical protein
LEIALLLIQLEMQTMTGVTQTIYSSLPLFRKSSMKRIHSQ